MVRLTWAHERGDRLALVRERGGLTPRKQRVILVHFDTAAISAINVRRRMDDQELMICPAKYAAVSWFGKDDNGTIAQCLLFLEHHRRDAVWFNDLIDLPKVIDQLRNKDRRLESVTYVDWIIDYPFDRETRVHGTSIVSL